MNSLKSTAKILICGGRHFDDYCYLERVIDHIIAFHTLDIDTLEIVSGHCEGTDQLGERYAKKHGIACAIFPAKWEQYKKAAGPIRNTEMVEYTLDAETSICVGFLSPRSKGTHDTINKAIKKQIETHVFPYKNKIGQI